MSPIASNTLFARLALAATALAFLVVVLGAWVRLTDAGLGCPDWPGCYGALAPTDAAHDTGKAWREMIHRYAAGTLGLLIAALALLAWRRRHYPGQQVGLPLLLVALVVFQAALGMWTVTWLLHPVVVMLHLLGGLSILALLWWLSLRQGGYGSGLVPGAPGRALAPVRRWLVGALVVLALQVALGGWTSANYAALACPDFPTCHGELWPPADWGAAFDFNHPIGDVYAGGRLDAPARVAIHMAHRLGALVTFLYIASLCTALVRRPPAPGLRAGGAVTLLLAIGQVALGTGNVLLGLPLWTAVAHNAGAALLLLALCWLLHLSLPPRIAL